MPVVIFGRIEQRETIAAGVRVRQRARLRRTYGGVHWRKRKGFTRVRLPDGRLWWAEVHWYESHGVGRRELKIKRLLKPA